MVSMETTTARKISFHRTDEKGKYAVRVNGAAAGTVQRYRDRTQVMSGPILVGHTERTAWKAIFQGRVVGSFYRTRDDAARAVLAERERHMNQPRPNRAADILRVQIAKAENEQREINARLFRLRERLAEEEGK